MLTRLLSTICPPAFGPVEPAAPRADCWPPAIGADEAAIDDFSPNRHNRGDEAVRRFRRLAESCTDGLTALAYAQFADLLEGRPGSGATAVRVARHLAPREILASSLV